MTNHDEQPVFAIQHFKDRYLSSIPPNNFDRYLWDQLEIVSAYTDDSGDYGKVYFSITIPRTYANHKNTFHGSAIATLFDGLSSSALALISNKGAWNGTEVSRNLEIKFFKPVPLGEPLNAGSEILHVGSRLSTVRGVIKRASNGVLLASCQHERYNSLRAKL